jgi:hypothetical protein
MTKTVPSVDRVRRERLPSPSHLHEDLEKVRRLCRETIKLTEIAETGYEELYEASLHQGRGHDGIPPGKQGFIVADPTGDTAVSGPHARLRSHVRRIAAKLRRLEPLLEEADRMIVYAFAEHLDPDFRDKLRRMRELEDEVIAKTTSM